ncbi:hypothetical protein [Dethiothermospora halolimnae]|uniref:hypothetical protein n=1 Tax=Dethiothermospora halolimnae TaxID=3114390 RepID=UPI003CCC2BB8
MDFVKVLKLTQGNLDSNDKVTDIKDDNITRISRYNFLIKALETFNNKKFNSDELITQFIKINLSVDKEKAKEQWFDGVEYDGHIYKAWFATVGGMKKENNGICDTIFIREDYEGFAEIVERLISLDKFSELEQEERIICINKDVISRLSLITSDLITEIDMPNFIVLPTATIEWVRDYKTVKPIKYEVEDKKGNMIEKIDYELVDYHFDTKKIDEDGEKIDEIEAFDGGGIATPKVFNSIGNSLKRDDIEFAIIRGYSNAMKGLITKFDIIKYLDSMYEGDTEYCRKINGRYELLDRWNDWQVVTDNTMLLNESMVKLAKYFDDMKDYKDRLEKVEPKYKDIIKKLYITKVNKPDKDIGDYRRSNYQVMNSLALTLQDYAELTKQDRKVFKKILKPFDYEATTKEFIENIDYIKLFYNQCVNREVDESDDDFEEKIFDKCSNVVDKSHELININPEFVKLNYVKRNLRRLIEKKVRELACGKVTIKAKYQYMAIDPISYMNFAMTRNQGTNGLLEGEFYSGDCKDGDIRTIQRCPQSAYSEVHNVKFISNSFLDTWLCKSKELIYFNQKSDIQNLLSSADFDGDACTVIDEPIIRNTVVTPKDGKYFIALNDGKKQELPYNKENRFESTYEAAGNLIGKIALKAANINCECQLAPSFYDTVNKKFIDWYDLKVEFDLEEKGDEFKDYIKEKKETGEFVEGWKPEKELRQHMKNKFYEHEKEIYTVLYNSMMAIDAVKTLVFPTKKDLEILDKKYYKKVNFLKYRENNKDVDLDQYYYSKNNLLDKFANLCVQNKFLDIIENNIKDRPKFSDRSDLLQKCFSNDNYDKDDYDACYKEIEKLYEDYNSERKVAERECSKANRKLYKEKRYYQDELGTWDKWIKESHEIQREENKQEKYKKYKEIDKKYIPIGENIIDNFDMATICECISNLSKCTENFIISLFWKCFSYVHKKGTNMRYIYEKYTEEDGQNKEKFDIEYLYEKYIRQEVRGFNNSNVIENIATENKVRLELEKKVRFKMNEYSVVDEIEEGLEKGEYKLSLDDNRIESFEEFKELIEDKDSLAVVGFQKRKDGTNSIAKTSFGVMVKVEE